MNIYIDVGNTATKFAVDDNQQIKYTRTIDTAKIMENGSVLELLDLDVVNNVYISSVVPVVSKTLEEYFYKKYKASVCFVSPRDESGVEIKIDNRDELGADLLCDLAGAKELFGYPILIVDLGTATKFLLIDDKGAFSTCAIIQGLELSLRNLAQNTALLPMLSFDEVKPLLENRNTKDVLISSAYYSHIDMINGMVARYKKAVSYPLKVVLTGGNIKNIKNDLDFDYEIKDFLCLEGLKIIVNNRK